MKYRGSEAEQRALDAYIKLMRAAESVTSRLAGELRRAGLTTTQLGVLEALLHIGPMDQTDLARKQLKSPANLTTVVDNLERRKLVRRTDDPTDRRKRVVELTEEGRRLITDYFPRHAAAIAREMGVLEEEQQQILGQLCRRLGYGNSSNN